MPTRSSRCANDSPREVFPLEVDGEAAGGIGLSLHQDVERVSAELGYWLVVQVLTSTC